MTQTAWGALVHVLAVITDFLPALKSFVSASATDFATEMTNVTLCC